MSRATRDERRASMRIALRLALRSSRRSIGRSMLIATMVALPVVGLTGIAIVYSSGQPSLEERIVPALGQNEAQLQVVSPPSSTLTQSPLSLNYSDPTPTSGEFRDPADVLPPGTTMLALGKTRVTATTATGVGTFNVTEGPAWAESFAGKYDIVAGRAPRSDAEVMVTPSLLSRLGVDLGDSVELRGAAVDTVVVVGLLDSRTEADTVQTMFARDGALHADESGDVSTLSYYLPDTAVDWEAVQHLNKEGIIVLSKAVMLDPPASAGGMADQDLGSLLALIAVTAMVAGLAAFEVVLLAGAAFTVTARQQQRMLATIASIGAPRRLLFRILAANGIVLGGLGGAIGALVGIGGALIFQLATADGSSTQYYGVKIPWLALIGFVLFAIAIGWIASLAPARAASRFDVVAALRGSRKPPAPSKRKPAIGTAMLLAGVVVTILGGILLAILMQAGRGIGGGHPLLWIPIAALILGPILAQLGLVLCGPLLLSAVARVMRRSGLGARLASRDAARNPSRAVPALSAVMTTVFIAVLAMCMVSAGQQNSRQEHHYLTPLGTVAVPLSFVQWDAQTNTGEVVEYPHAAAAEQALRATLDIEQARVLKAVADPWSDGTESPSSAEAVAVVTVPPANLCPSAPGSPEYSEAINDPGSSEYRAALGDWRCQGSYIFMSGATRGHIFVGDERDLALALGAEPSAQAKAALAGGSAVSLYSEYVLDGTLNIEWWDTENASRVGYGGQQGTPERSVTLDAVVETPAHPYDFGIFVSRETADRIGLTYSDAVLLASTSTLPSEADRDALAEAMYNLPENANGNVYASLELGPPQYATTVTWALLGLTAVIALAAAAVAIGLARFDGRQDDATLSSLGAPGRVRRSFAFWQGLIITGTGAVLGAAIGLVPALALSADKQWPFSAPWLQIGLAVVALPLAISLGSWVAAGRGKTSARRLSMS